MNPANSNLVNMVGISHQDAANTRSFYLHFRKNSIVVNMLETVERGQLLGYAGSSGYSSGPHLHFEAYLNSTLASPDTGSCQTAQPTLWQDPPAYNPTLPFNLIRTGITMQDISNRAVFFERPPMITTATVGNQIRQGIRFINFFLIRLSSFLATEMISFSIANSSQVLGLLSKHSHDLHRPLPGLRQQYPHLKFFHPPFGILQLFLLLCISDSLINGARQM